MRNLLRIWLCIILIFSFVGCGVPDKKTAEKSEDKAATGAVNEKTEPTEADDQRQSEDEDISDDPEKIAVVFFSGTGNTKAVANLIASEIGADIYEIIPKEKYSVEDLNYSNFAPHFRRRSTH